MRALVRGGCGRFVARGLSFSLSLSALGLSALNGLVAIVFLGFEVRSALSLYGLGFAGTSAFGGFDLSVALTFGTLIVLLSFLLAALEFLLALLLEQFELKIELNLDLG